MQIDQEKLRTFLVDSGLVEKKAFEKALKTAKEKEQSVADILITQGLFEEDELRRIQANILGIPFISLKDKKVDFEVLSMIPEPIARNHNIIAYKKNADSLEVAMLNVNDLAAIDFIKKKVGLKIQARLTDTESIKTSLQQYQKSLKAEFGEIIKKETETLKTVVAEEGEEVSEKELQKMAEDLPVVRIVDTLIKHAILQDASDIHIQPQEKELLVRYRIDGILHDAMVLPKHAAPSISARIKVLSKLKLDEKRIPQDGRFKVEADSYKVSFRVSVLPMYYGEKIVMRLLKDKAKGFSLETLGFHGENLERIHWSTKQRTGMILTTGPTGSGKSTTLYTVLDLLNTPEVNISTIEDPIEYQMPRITQTQVKPDIGFSFGEGLRSLMRQDPDIIMVGEVRDKETASLAINAALTGHLVLSTLHTNSAAGAVPRLIDMGVEPFLLVSTLRIVIGQRLVRRLCKRKEEHTLTQAEIDNLGTLINLDTVLARLKEESVVDSKATWNSITFYKPKESDECKDGYSGRMGIHEVLKMSDSIKDMVVGGASAEEIHKQSVKEGMVTMLEDGIHKAAMGVTSIEEVLRVVSE